MRKAPLFERKAALRAVIAKSDILLSFETDGAAMLKQACKMGLEASSRRSATPALIPGGPTIGPKSPAASARRCRLQASRSMAASGMACTSVA
jgi:hypothetical protein